MESQAEAQGCRDSTTPLQLPVGRGAAVAALALPSDSPGGQPCPAQSSGPFSLGGLPLRPLPAKDSWSPSRCGVQGGCWLGCDLRVMPVLVLLPNWGKDLPKRARA